MIMTRTEFLEMTSLDGPTLEIWLQEEWLLPEGHEEDFLFSDMDVARVQLIRSLNEDMGVNPEGISVVLHLMDQIYALRGALKATTKTEQA